jgi:GT2 family glycosyltransferase
VVFLAYNRRDALRESVTRMLHQSGYPRERLEVIVVDNASTDGTAGMLAEEALDVRLVTNAENLGAPGWNAGFAVARGDYILILDDDAYLPEGALREAVTAAEAEGADLVSFTVVSSFDSDHPLNDDWRTGLFSFWGCAALVSRRAMTALRGYDPDMFIWANEVDFTMRLLDAGFRHLFLPDVVAVHMKERITDWEPRRYRVNARHHAYIAAKLMRPLDAAVVVRNLLLNALLDTAAENREAIGTIPLVFAGVADGLRRRRPVRRPVSAAYRHHFRVFALSWRFLRGPVARWRARSGGADADAQRARRQDRYFTDRERFYPAGRGSLRI